MWRAFFLALGVFLCLLGGEFLACDHFVLRAPVRETQIQNTMQNVAFTVPSINQKRIYVPKDWMPWTLLASGAIVLIYSIRPRS